MAVLTAVLLFVVPTLAASAAQGTQAEIIAIRPGDEIYTPSEEVRVEFEVRDRRDPTRGGGDFVYGASIVVEDADRNIVFSSQDEGINGTLRLAPGEFDSIVFRWSLPSDAKGGTYSILGSLHDEEFDEIFDIWDLADGASFIVEEGIRVAADPEEHDFGVIDPEDTPGRSISVLNEGVGTLVWQVIDWPKEWLNLVDPLPGESIRGRGRIRVEVREDTPFGDFEGQILVESNGGNLQIPVFASVEGNPNGKVTRLKINGESRYSQGEAVEVDVRIENTGDVIVDYRVTLLAESAGQAVYDSNVVGEDLRVLLEPEESADVTFFWNIPTFARRGDYVVRAELRSWHDFQCQLFPFRDCGEFQDFNPRIVLECIDEIPNPTPTPVSTPTGTPRVVVIEPCDTFDIRLSPPRLLISPGSHGFGNVELGETPEVRFQVTNSGRGTLVWEVAELPDWLELIRPTSEVTGPGEIVVKVKDSAPGGRFTGEIGVLSTGGNDVIPVSISIDAPDPTRTPTPTATQTHTPTVTPTPTPVTPTATPEPLVLPPSVLDGSITVRNGSISDDTRLVARIGDYESLPAFIQEGQYSNLVVSPIGEEFLGQPIEFLLDGVRATNPIRPIFYIPNTFRTVNLIFDNVGTPEPTPVTPTPTATSTPAPPSPTPTVRRPTVTVTSTITPTATVTPTPTIVIVVVTSTPFSFDQEPGSDSDSDAPPTSAGACSATVGHVSVWTGAANVLLFIAPLGMIAGYRRWN